MFGDSRCFGNLMETITHRGDLPPGRATGAFPDTYLLPSVALCTSSFMRVDVTATPFFFVSWHLWLGSSLLDEAGILRCGGVLLHFLLCTAFTRVLSFHERDVPTSPRESLPGPKNSDGPLVGRSAPEIDIFEVQVSAHWTENFCVLILHRRTHRSTRLSETYSFLTGYCHLDDVLESCTCGLCLSKE